MAEQTMMLIIKADESTLESIMKTSVENYGRHIIKIERYEPNNQKTNKQSPHDTYFR